MFDITEGEVGKILRINLRTIDNSQNPPAVAPLDLTGATSVTLQYAWGKLSQPIGSIKEKAMSVMDAVNGVVQYVFASTDLDAPGGFSFTGEIEYTTKVVYPTKVV